MSADFPDGVYVDPLAAHGFRLRGRVVQSCHLVTNMVDLSELHRIAAVAGMRREWFQDGSSPHYDLTESRREAAIAAGAVPVDRVGLVAVVRQRRARLAEVSDAG